MSHNQFKIGTAKPNLNGDVTISISNLSDVSITSPSSGQVLEWAGSAWSNANLASSGYTAEFMLIGQGESNAYSNATTATNISDGDTLFLYDTSPVNTISGATISKVGSTDWVQSFTLPIGNYIMMATYAVEFSATGNMSFHFQDSSNVVISGLGAIGENLSAIENSSGYIQGYREFSSSTTVKLCCELPNNVDTVANQGNTPAQQSSIMLWRV